MITVAEGLKIINYLASKENSGSTLSPQEYNSIMKAVTHEMTQEEFDASQVYAIQKNIPFSEAIASNKTLREFRKKQSITFTSGAYDLAGLAGGYLYWAGLITTSGGQLREIDIVTDKERMDRITNLLAKSPTNYPCAIINGNSLEVTPSNITSGVLTYYSRPVNPVFDYYIDANLSIIPFAVGDNHTLQAGEVSSTGETSGYFNSLTVELPFNYERHMNFFNRVLAKVGINLKDVQLKQAAEQVLGKQL